MDFDDITLAAFKDLAMEQTRRELLVDARAFYDGRRADDLKVAAKQVAIGERERLLKKLGWQES